MTHDTLALAADLPVHADIAVQTTLLVGKRGSGKTSTAKRFAEQLHSIGVPFVALDPVDAWWGLKASRDGKGPGLPVFVFGGRHADLPLESGGGSLMADVAVDHRIPMVLSIKHFSGRERTRFVTDFARRLFQRNQDPLHLFLEEAHEVASQHPFKGEEEMLGAITRLWKLGRSAGIGGTAITQRPASLSKDITTQAEVLIVHRLIGPQDRAAVKEWIKYHGESEEILAELSGLKTGEAYLWAPDYPEDHPIGLRRIKVLPCETFDSTATPKPGERKTQPKALAEVDLDRLRGQMAATIEKSRSEDPRELKRQLAALQTRVVDQERHILELEQRPPTVAGLGPLEHELLVQALGSIQSEVQTALKVAERIPGAQQRAIDLGPGRVIATPSSAEMATMPLFRPDSGETLRRLLAAGAPAEKYVYKPTGPGTAMPTILRKILAVLAEVPEGLRQGAVAVSAGFSGRGGGSGSFKGAIAKGRTEGWIEGSSDRLGLTEAGRQALGATEPPLSGPDLLNYWLTRLPGPGGGGMAARILHVLAVRHPHAVGRDALLSTLGYRDSGSFKGALAMLRARQLMTVRGPGVFRMSDRLAPVVP